MTVPKFKVGQKVYNSVLQKTVEIESEPIWNGYSFMYEFVGESLRCGEEYLHKEQPIRKLDDAEILFCKYQYHILGGFFTDFIRCIMRSDDTNRAKIAMGFPELVQVVERYQHEDGYWQELESIWETQYMNQKK